MQSESIEQRFEKLQAELQAVRSKFDEKDSALKALARENSDLKASLCRCNKQIQLLTKENAQLKKQMVSATDSNAFNTEKINPFRNSMSFDQSNEIANKGRTLLKTEGKKSQVLNLVPHSVSVPEFLEQTANRPLHNSSEMDGKEKLADRLGNKFAINFDKRTNKESQTNALSPGLTNEALDKGFSNFLPNAPRTIMQAFTPQLPKRFFTIKNSSRAINSKEPRRSESISSRIIPSSFLRNLDYREYLMSVTQKDKAEKIRFLIDLCNPRETTHHPDPLFPCVPQKEALLISGLSPMLRTLVPAPRLFFKDDSLAVKQPSFARRESNAREEQSQGKTPSQQKGPSPAQRQAGQGTGLLESVREEDGNELLGKALNRNNTLSFSDVSHSEEGSGSRNQELDPKEQSPVKSMITEAFDLHKLYEDFLIVSCQKEQLANYISENEIAFSVVFDLYALDKKDPNNQNNELVKFMIPFSQQVRTVKIKNTIGKLNEVLFQDEASCKTFEFFSISLNSNIASEGPNRNPKATEAFFKDGDLGVLKEANPGLCFYYYCAKIEDFFIDGANSKQFTSDLIEFCFFPKYFVVKTLYPFAQLFYNVLQQILSLSKRKRIEKFLESIKQGKVEIETLERIDGQGMMDCELAAIIPLFEKLDAVSIANNFEEAIKIEIPNISINFAIPPLKNCSFVEAEFGFVRVLSSFSFEEFLFVFFAIMLEHTVVFVSEDLGLLSACLSTFVALLRPFKWPFPVIYSLPEDCLIMLGSPIPLLVGLNLPADTVVNDVLPEHEKKTRAEANANIYVFLDHGLFYYDFEALDALLIPQYDEFVEKLEKIYKKYFSQRVSNYFRVLKKKKNKCNYTYIKKQNTAKLKEKIVKLDRTLQTKSPEKTQLEKFRLSNFGKQNEEAQIFHFFRYFFNSFIISKLPHDRTMSYFGKETRIKEIDVSFFSTNSSDIEFLEAFMKTQSFMFYIENDFYGITNPTHEK